MPTSDNSPLGVPKPARAKAASSSSALLGRVREILEAARAGVARTVNTTQVAANWLIGREIVEEEQRGQRRAGYGAKLLAELSARLNTEFGRGYSVDNLEAFRQFYLEYPRLISETAPRKLLMERLLPAQAISATPSRKSAREPGWLPGALHPSLSWSHSCLSKLG
ncbi:DUF1016 N-terminal domain-containing protein [Variovorax boronicumulans]|uniref:DUF1016 N-terminal domain-containing protein n=1 Tax=Variovorax boronicumulans TaxID=436515 RepID=UPI003399AA1A